jgi:hypothetical protein
MNNLTIQKGNLYEATITFTYEDSGLPIDITDVDVFFSAKKKNDNTNDDTLAVITQDIAAGTHTDPTHGITTLQILPANTNVACGCYKCDFKLYNAGILQYNTQIFFADVVEVVTKRIT